MLGRGIDCEWVYVESWGLDIYFWAGGMLLGGRMLLGGEGGVLLGGVGVMCLVDLGLWGCCCSPCVDKRDKYADGFVKKDDLVSA